MKAQLDRQVAELKTLLTSGLAGPPQPTFAMLKQTPEAPPFDPGDLADARPAPQWGDYALPPPGALSGLVGGKARYTRAREAASQTFQQALADHEQAEAVRGHRLQAARAQYDRVVQATEAEAREHNAAVDELELRFRAGVPEAVEEFFGQVLALSGLPAGFPGEYQVAYRPHPRELVVEYRLPPATVVPVIRDYRYVKARGEIDEMPRSLKDIKDLYASVIHQVALRTMRDCPRPAARPGRQKNST